LLKARGDLVERRLQPIFRRAGRRADKGQKLPRAH
jgi:hypothetical protein